MMNIKRVEIQINDTDVINLNVEKDICWENYSSILQRYFKVLALRLVKVTWKSIISSPPKYRWYNKENICKVTIVCVLLSQKGKQCPKRRKCPWQKTRFSAGRKAIVEAEKKKHNNLFCFRKISEDKKTTI